MQQAKSFSQDRLRREDEREKEMERRARKIPKVTKQLRAVSFSSHNPRVSTPASFLLFSLSCSSRPLRAIARIHTFGPSLSFFFRFFLFFPSHLDVVVFFFYSNSLMRLAISLSHLRGLLRQSPFTDEFQ